MYDSMTLGLVAMHAYVTYSLTVRIEMSPYSLTYLLTYLMMMMS